MQEEASSAFSVDNILKQVGDVVQAFVALPSQASRVLAQMESGGLVVQISASDARSPHAGAFGGSPDRRNYIRRVSGQRGDVIK